MEEIFFLKEGRILTLKLLCSNDEEVSSIEKLIIRQVKAGTINLHLVGTNLKYTLPDWAKAVDLSGE